jgi:hypothetical protein
MEPGRKFLQEGTLHRELKVRPDAFARAQFAPHTQEKLIKVSAAAMITMTIQGGKEMQPSYYFLFSDLIVLCKRGAKVRLGSSSPKADKSNASAIVPLISAETEVDLRLGGDEGAEGGGGGGNDTQTDTTVEITNSSAAGVKPNKTRQFVVQFASDENKRKWVQAYRYALERHASSPRLRPS